LIGLAPEQLLVQKPVWLVSHTPLMAPLVTKLSFVTRGAITESRFLCNGNIAITGKKPGFLHKNSIKYALAGIDHLNLEEAGNQSIIGQFIE
jgi:hypothetical protein